MDGVERVLTHKHGKYGSRVLGEHYKLQETSRSIRSLFDGDARSNLTAGTVARLNKMLDFRTACFREILEVNSTLKFSAFLAKKWVKIEKINEYERRGRLMLTLKIRYMYQ